MMRVNVDDLVVVVTPEETYDAVITRVGKTRASAAKIYNGRPGYEREFRLLDGRTRGGNYVYTPEEFRNIQEIRRRDGVLRHGGVHLGASSPLRGSKAFLDALAALVEEYAGTPDE